jgi:hypothetical protein
MEADRINDVRSLVDLIANTLGRRAAGSTNAALSIVPP